MTPVKFEHGFRGDDRLEQIFTDRRRLPKILARLHEWQTGLPDPREATPESSPLRQVGRDIWLLSGFMVLTGGSAILAVENPNSFVGLSAAVAALYGSMGVTGRLRRFVVGHTHEAGHGVIESFYEEKGLSREKAARRGTFVLDLGSILTLTKNGEDYKRAHERHHDEQDLGTTRDPDGMDLLAWGLWPGLGSSSFAADILATVLDPTWHAGILSLRLSSNFTTGNRVRRFAAFAVCSVLVGSAFVLPFPAWLMAVGLPWTVGYHTAALLQVLTEHPYGFESGAMTMAEHADRNWERIPIDPFPPKRSNALRDVVAWVCWWMRLTLVHLPSRLAVLDSSMIAHGWHHLAWPAGRPFSEWWDTSRRMVAARFHGDISPSAATSVVWGLPEALSLQARRFKAIARVSAPIAQTDDVDR